MWLTPPGHIFVFSPIFNVYTLGHACRRNSVVCYKIIQVHTNGLIFIDGKIGLVTPQMFSSIASGSFIAPDWVDNNPSMGGSVSYEVHNDGSALLRQVSCAISSRENINFRGTWMLVVYWFNVPLFERTVVSSEMRANAHFVVFFFLYRLVHIKGF